MSTFQFWNGVDQITESHRRAAAAVVSNNIYDSSKATDSPTQCCGSKSPSQGGDFSSQSTVTSVTTQQQQNWKNHGDDRYQQLGFAASVRSFHQETSPPSVDRSSLPFFSASDNSTVVFSNSSTTSSPTASSSSAAMSSFLPTSDALQTLYLMDPSYTGYGNSPNPSAMLLFNSTSAEQHLGSFGGDTNHHRHHHQQQQHQSHQNLLRLPHSSTMAQWPLHHQAVAMASPPNADPGQADIYAAASRQASHGHSWAGGSGMISGFPAAGAPAAESNLMLAGQMDSIRSYPYDARTLAARASFHQEQPMLLPSEIAAVQHDLSMAHLQPSGGGADYGHGQILSLSLSSQQPSLMQQIHGFPLQQQQNGNGIETPFVVPSNCDHFMTSSYQTQPQTMDRGKETHIFGNQSHLQSKYLKPAQDLLNEVVNGGKPVAVSNSASKRSNAQSNSQARLAIEDLAGEKCAAEISDKPVEIRSRRKETESIAFTSSGYMPEPKTENIQLTSSERQELHEKRAKLVGMRDEVDRRYKQYLYQMQSVVTSFEAAAGMGAAATYTSLALQTISKHFRCLRDAIAGRIQSMSKALGDEGMRKGESKLRLVGQQMRQQFALRHLGMVQQQQHQAWRPQRGLPEHSVSILRAWLFEHFLHPYPKDADKVLLARQTGLTRNQVSNWFINARVRLWKPMVEEMYVEETKEAEGNGAEKIGRDGGEHGHGMSADETNKPAKQAKLSSDESHDGKQSPEDMVDNFPFAQESAHQGMMKMVQASLLPPGSSAGPSFIKSDGIRSVDVLKQQEMKARAEESFREQYGMDQNGFLLTAGYPSADQISNLSRYAQEAFPLHGYAGSGGISLTLGLQHCEAPSFGGSYGGQARSHLAAAAVGSRQEAGPDAPADYYSLNDDNGFEALSLQNRKPPYMLRHDFVV